MKDDDSEVMIGASKKIRGCYARNDGHTADINTKMIWF
jgi:hypothetical protein